MVTGAAQPAAHTAGLWQESGLPDNHVDGHFLSSLVLKREVAWSYWRVVADAGVVARQISVVGIVSAVTGRLHQACAVEYTVGCPIAQQPWTSAHALALPQGRLQAGRLLVYNLAGAAVLAAITMGSGPCRVSEYAGLAARRAALLISGTYLLSPLLQTLTRTTSSDTVLAVAVYMLLLHMFLHTYRLRLSLTDKAAGTISLAAAIFASVLTASRLDSHIHVFGQVLLSLEAYLVLPYALHSLAARHPALSAAATTFCGVACGALLRFDTPVLRLYLLLVCFVSFVCPLWLVVLQRCSATPTGPWDVADIAVETVRP